MGNTSVASQQAGLGADTCGAPAVLPRAGSRRPLGTTQVSLTAGLLSQWQVRNRERTIPHVIDQIRAAGNLDNLRSVARPAAGEAADQVPAREFRGRYPFLDTDIYKLLEGLAYELGRSAAGELGRSAAGELGRSAAGPDQQVLAFWEEAVDLIERAQRPDGYLNSYVQSTATEAEPWADLAWGHELYTLGHLIQAAVAAHRRLGDDRLLTVARRFADLAVRTFGPDGEPAVDGHPEVEMALVELYRETGHRPYLDLARLLVDRRGHGTIDTRVFPSDYFQDHVPLREMASVTGHAVRMAYLAAGATDVAMETGDAELLGALERLWDDMVATKLYLTGGLGSRHDGEAIGDRFELPSDRAYAETCAAIATMQWAWRMFLATGGAGYLDVYERVLLNAYAVGLSDDGCAFFYDNPLQRRPDHTDPLRRAWFSCPCCPPNVVRWTAELQDHLAVLDGGRLRIGLYATGTIAVDGLSLDVVTDYPWDPAITITVRETSAEAPDLSLRIPGWCRGANVRRDEVVVAEDLAPGWCLIADPVPGETIRLTLPMPVRRHVADPRVDALRGQTAFTRGPVVYCAEQIDQTGAVDDLVVPTTAAAEAESYLGRPTPNTDPATRLIRIPAEVAPTPVGELYPVLPDDPALPTTRATLTLVPYYLWGNRGAMAMRVWLRTTPLSHDPTYS